MALYRISGWDKTTARQVTWYLEATTDNAAMYYVYSAGLLSPLLDKISAAPPGERVINVEDELSSRAGQTRGSLLGDRLVWRIALGVMLGILGASIVLSTFRCSMS